MAVDGRPAKRLQFLIVPGLVTMPGIQGIQEGYERQTATDGWDGHSETGCGWPANSRRFTV